MCLKHRKDVDRALTGDGVTKQRTPFINFLVNVPGKGTKLVDTIDCTEHLSTDQVKDTMWVMCELLGCGAEFQYFLISIEQIPHTDVTRMFNEPTQTLP